VIANYKHEALLRLKTVRGHIDGVIGMVEDEVYCPDLMKQVAALQASLEKVNRVLLRNHLETCVSEAIRTGQGQEKIAELMEALPYNSGLTDFRYQADPLPLPGRDEADTPDGSARTGRRNSMNTGAALPAAPPGPSTGGGEAHLTLEITGMTCASCVRRVERALTAVPGVAQATVNLAAESADVTPAPPAEADPLLAAVADAGYQAVVPADMRTDDVARRRAAQAAELRGRRTRLYAGAILSAAVLVIAYGFASAAVGRVGATGAAIAGVRLDRRGVPPRRAGGRAAPHHQHGHPGWHRPRRPARAADPRRREPRTRPRPGHRGAGQDRHPLTVGHPAVVRLLPLDGSDGQDALALAAAAETASEHPLARAVAAAAEDRGLAPARASDVEAIAGCGVTATVGGQRVQAGSLAWLAATGTDTTATAQLARDLAGAAQTPVAVAVDGRLQLLLGVADALRPDSPAGVARLRALGLQPVLATGDTLQAAADAAGIGTVHAGLLPQDKSALVDQLRRDHGPVAMVGDGINDAPALAAADITLVHGGVGAVADAVMLARATRRIIRQNLGWAFGYNLLLVPLAATGILPPVLAALTMATSSVTVVGNALRLRRFGHNSTRHTTHPYPGIAAPPPTAPARTGAPR
jgi:DNA-binding FrmR family transcriptional regulator/copper chaperone CopZ/soluble P-type ATPase